MTLTQCQHRNTIVMAEVHLIRALRVMKKPFREKLLLIQCSYWQTSRGGVMLNAQNNKPPLRGLGVIPIIPFEAQCAEWSGSLGRPATLLGMVFSFFLEFFLICGTL